MKRFIEVSKRAVGTLNFAGCEAKDDRTTRHDMHFAVVADKLDLSSIEGRLEKEKYNFYCVGNKLVYVTPAVLDNCAHAGVLLLIFDLSTFTRVSEGHFMPCC